MSFDKKCLCKALIFIAVAFIMWIRIPHINMSLSQIILPRFHIDKIRSVNISGILILIPLYLAYRHLIKSSLFINNKVISILLLFLIVPIVFNMLSTIKQPYYKYLNGIKSIEIIDDGYCFDYAYQNICDIHFYAKLKNYANSEQEFEVALVLPQELIEKGMPKEIVMPDKYTIKGNGELKIDKRYDIKELHKFKEQEIESVYYDFIEYKIRLFNEKESLVIYVNR